MMYGYVQVYIYDLQYRCTTHILAYILVQKNLQVNTLRNNSETSGCGRKFKKNSRVAIIDRKCIFYSYVF